jgi:hypothetical protein
MPIPAKHGPPDKVNPNVPVFSEPVKPAPWLTVAPDTEPELSPGRPPPPRPGESDPESDHRMS